MRKSSRKRSKVVGDAGLQIDKTSDQGQLGVNSYNHNNVFDPNSTSSPFNSNKDGVNHFHCGVCSKDFQTVELLSSHMYTHNDTGLFQCNICDKVLSTSDLLSLHLDKHENVVKPFKCGICSAGFIENALLLEHINQTHKTLPPLYKCRMCSFPFTDILKLVTHMIDNHSSKLIQMKCGICSQVFNQENELSFHVQTHIEGPKKLSKCPVCFSKVPASIMDNHIIAHQKEKDKTISPSSRSQNLIKTKKKLGKQQKFSLRLRDKISNVTIAENLENVVKQQDNDNDMMETESEETNENESAKVKKGRKRKSLLKVLKQNSAIIKPIPAVKDTKKILSAFMKIDLQTGNAVYDCDVCGLRIDNKESFTQHRNDHFCDGKFCINCRHCSQSFDSFEELSGHVGPGKCVGYKCKTCEESFSLEPVLLTHQIKQHSSLTKQNGVFTCTVCGKVFENKTAFIRHASSHSEDKCIQCKLCRHAFTTQETLLGHLRTTHSIIPITRKQYKFNCDVCDAKFMKDEALATHKANVHNIEKNSTNFVQSDLKIKDTKPIETKKKIGSDNTMKRTGHWRSAEDDKKRRTCPVCNRVFRRFKDVRRHIGTHTKPYLCSHCGKSFPYRYSLDAHIKAYHSSENPHKCETCNKYFSCERSLLIHRRIHTGEKPHQCHICQKSFRQVANLSMHIKLHSADKPIKCELCDYRCSHQGYLKRHMSTHSSEKKHMCPICNKGFTEKPNLNHHLKRHSKVKNHVCAVCGHRFAERYYLNNHMRIHTKEKPYVCPVCNRAFTMRPNMVSHIKKTHPSYKYQPMRPSHKQLSDSNSNKITTTLDNETVDTGILNTQGPSLVEVESITTTAVPSCNDTFTSINSNSMPNIMTPATPLLHTNTPPQLPPPPLPLHQPSQLHQATQPPSYVTSSAGNNDLLYRHPSNSSTFVKLDPVRLPPAPPRNILSHFPQQQQQQQQASVNHVLQDTNVQRNEDLQISSNAIVEQNVIQDQSEGQHYNVNVSDRFISPHFVDPQRIVPLSLASAAPPCQSYPTVPLASQDYMYAYPNMQQSNNFLPVPVQGLFTNHQVHQNSNSLTTEEQKL